MVNLVEDTIDRADIKRLIKWLETFPRLTKGPITIEFEGNKPIIGLPKILNIT